jgi:hypothetical protein
MVNGVQGYISKQMAIKMVGRVDLVMSGEGDEQIQE